jgi:hypothetical protein
MHRTLTILIAILSCGCSWFHSAPPKPAIIKMPRAEPLTQLPKLVGIVTLVNSDDRFVLVEENQGIPLHPGTALKTFRAGVESGVIAVGQESRRPFITADIVSGDPQRGDQVFQ